MPARKRYSIIFTIFHRAILDRKQVTFTYGGRHREVCPYILGHTKGEEKLLGFQFGGESRRGLPPGGEWRCFGLAGISDVETRSGRWHGESEHRRTQHCVDIVYIDVNTAVPNQPGRRPAATRGRAPKAGR